MSPSIALSVEDGLLAIAGPLSASQSSAYGDLGDAARALGDNPSGQRSFQTLFEERPWWEVDFGALVPLRRIVVWNCEEEGLEGAARARPLRVLAAAGRDGWIELARIFHVFGGRRSGRPLVIDLAAPIRARWLRLEVQGRSTLHLDRVQAFGGAPLLRYAGVEGLRQDGPGLWRAGIAAHHDGGFFSVCSTLLESVNELHYCGILTDRIDASGTFGAYRDGSAAQDLYADLFRPDPAIPLDDGATPYFRATVHNHTQYRDIDLAALAPYLRRHFCPSDAVVAREAELLGRAGIDPALCVGLCYRGTDKHREIAPATVADYIAVAEKLLGADPRLRVLVQTDQAQIRAALIGHFGDRCVHFAEMPVTTGDVALHDLDLAREHGMAKPQFARTLLASIRILARCRHLIAHTGNAGLWLALYRGTAEGFYQFDRDRVLVPPPS